MEYDIYRIAFNQLVKELSLTQPAKEELWDEISKLVLAKDRYLLDRVIDKTSNNSGIKLNFNHPYQEILWVYKANKNLDDSKD